MSERVLTEVQDHVAIVRMNRPDKHNALDSEQFRAVVEAGMELQDRSDVRAVVLTGEGPSFCSGLDYASIMASGPDALNKAFEHDGVEPANNAQSCAHAWRALPVPVIAAIHGNALGGGFQIAMGADIRVAAPDARFSIMEIEYGLVPDMAITHTLRRTLAMDVIKELAFTGRIFDGREALALGVVTRLADDPLAEAVTLARSIADRSPDAIRGIKQLFESAWDDDVAAGYELEARLQKSVIGQPNQMEAVMAKMQKRPAKFSDPG